MNTNAVFAEYRMYSCEEKEGLSYQFIKLYKIFTADSIWPAEK